MRRIFRNWLGLTGVVVAAASVFAFVLLFAIDVFSHHGNPYMGILAYLVAPGFTFTGLSFMAIGWWIQRRHELSARPGAAPHVLSIDLSRPRDWKMLAGFLLGTVLFLLVTALGSYETYHYTESVQFCGQACHEPMKPEFTTYLNSPHARVECVECHVGSGAGAYVKSKINGVRQLVCTITGNISRPIKTPIHNLRPAQDTCEQCHWPQKFSGQVERTRHRFLADETNTAYSVRLLLNVGGGDPTHGPVGGIHWHMNLSSKVEYIATDAQRQVIPWVRLTDANGEVTEFRSPDFKGDTAAYEIRRMDCTDCHNRPAHRFKSPNDAVDLAMATGRIDPAMPWVKSNVVAALIQPYKTEGEALEKISAALRKAYAGDSRVAKLSNEAQAIFKANIFPEMKADWRAYPDNISHKEWAGCFRCHDGQHKSADGKRTIKASDCNSCHLILAQGSGVELDKLNPKGHRFFHIDSEYTDFSCAGCHTGAFPK